MFVSTATWGRKRSTPSSWKDDSSHTKSRGPGSARKPESGAPMLPESATGRPARFRISAIHVVVVDFPFVPVTAIQRCAPGASASAILHAASISERTGMPRARASRTERDVERHAGRHREPLALRPETPARGLRKRSARHGT